MDDIQARDALAAIGQAKQRLAETQDCPPWRHAALGGVMAVMMAANVLPHGYFAPLYVLTMIGIVWLLRGDRRRSGTFVNGWRRGRTLPVTILLFVSLLGLLFLGRETRGTGFINATGVLVIFASFVLGVVFSVFWQKVYQAELREGAN